MIGEAAFWTIAVFLACLFIVFVAISRARKKRQRQQMIEAMQSEAEDCLRQIQATGRLPTVDTHIVLQPQEFAVLQESASLYEARSYRVYGGAGTRIKGVYVGGGVSESHQRLKQIDSGMLVLTNCRLVFDGSMENRSIKLNDVVSAQPWTDAVEVSSSRRQKSQVYTVANPIIWTTMITALAKSEAPTPEVSRPKPTQADIAIPTGRGETLEPTHKLIGKNACPECGEPLNNTDITCRSCGYRFGPKAF